MRLLIEWLWDKLELRVTQKINTLLEKRMEQAGLGKELLECKSKNGYTPDLWDISMRGLCSMSVPKNVEVMMDNRLEELRSDVRRSEREIRVILRHLDGYIDGNGVFVKHPKPPKP